MNLITVNLDNLYFDPNNFRYEDNFDSVSISDENAIKKSVQNKIYKKISSDIKDLKQGILANDFIYFETIIVKDIGNDQYIVIEGNRRTATLKLLATEYSVEDLDDHLPNLKSIFEEGIEVRLMDASLHDEEILMGMRHVTGVKQWKGFSKAKLIVKLKDDKHYTFAQIANKLTSRPNEIKKRYNAIKLLENMIDSNYDYEDISDLYTLFIETLGKPAFRDWLEYDEDQIKFKNQVNLERFYSWIIPLYDEESGDTKRPIITNPQSLRETSKILDDSTALDILETERDVFKAVANSVILKDREIYKTLKKIYESSRSISLEDILNIDEDGIKLLKNIEKNFSEMIEYLKFKKIIT